MMQQHVQKKTAIAFWALVLVDVTGIALNLQMLHFITKPLLVPALLLLLFLQHLQYPEKIC